MKLKYVLAFFLTVPVLLLAGWVVKLESGLHGGREVVVQMSGFDPVDFLSGHYLSLRPDWEKTDCAQFEDGKCPYELFSRFYRYYLPEFDAAAVDEEIRRNNDLPVALVFAVNGRAKPRIKQLLIGGKDWQDWIKQFSTRPDSLKIEVSE